MEKLGRDYDGLDLHGQKTVRAVADVEKARCSEAAQAAPAQTYDDIDRQVEDYRRLILEKNQAERLSPSNVDGTQTVSNKPAQPGGEYRRGLLMNNEEKILALLEEIRATQKKHGEMLERHDETLSSLQQTVTRVALTQENIVLKSLDALAEGQDLTHQRLKDLAGKDELAELREEVRLLRTVVAQHTRDIEALKAAQ